VVAVGIDGVAGEVMAGGRVDDVDGVFVDEHQDRCVGVRDCDAEVVQSSGAAQGEFREAVDDVDADSVVDVGVVAAGSRGLQGGVVGGCRGLAVGSVHPVVVVGLLERVELVLEVGEGVGCGLGAEPAFEGLVEAFDLSLGFGGGRSSGDREVGEQVFEALRPPRNRAV
jgi:hypothetical protein